MPCLPPTLRHAVLAFATIIASGCTHFANITEVPNDDGVATYVSSRSWGDGTPRTIVTERVFSRPDAPCDLLRIQREFFDETGMLQQRVTDFETCGLVLTRTTHDYDLADARVTQVTQRDSNRDGQFDVERVASSPVSVEQIAALTVAAQSH